MRRQNPYQLVFKSISTFDGQNQIIGNLLSAIEIGKQTQDSIKKILKKAPPVKNIDIESNPEKLFNRNLPGKKDDRDDGNADDDNDGNYNNDNNNGAAVLDNLQELPDIPKQDPAEMVKIGKPEIENKEKILEGLSREKKN